MNWSRAKSILIFFLILTNLFLASMLVRSAINNTRILPETVNNAVLLLKERKVTVDASVIPTKIETKRIFTVENVIADYTEFAKKVLGENFSILDNTYSTETASITFNGDSFSIKYNDGIETDVKLKTPTEKSRAYLAALGIDTSKASAEVKNDAHGLFTVTFTEKLGNMLFFDRRVSVELLGERIVSAGGCWFTKTDVSSTQSTLDSVPSLLVKYASGNAEFSNIEISDITLGYAIGEANVFHKTANVLPIYEISCTDGRVFFIDALSN
ncbi:MAG: hypothetical protein IJ366_02490 [Clostridia bacterium]|nr:hypothetical protein [Clostridia bacterium]